MGGRTAEPKGKSNGEDPRKVAGTARRNRQQRRREPLKHLPFFKPKTEDDMSHFAMKADMPAEDWNSFDTEPPIMDGPTDKEIAEAHKRADAVYHPAHYCRGGIECIDAIRASMSKEAFAGYCKGNAIKYLWRYEDKGGVESLKKAQVYLGWLIDTEEKA